MTRIFAFRMSTKQMIQKSGLVYFFPRQPNHRSDVVLNWGAAAFLILNMGVYLMATFAFPHIPCHWGSCWVQLVSTKRVCEDFVTFLRIVSWDRNLGFLGKVIVIGCVPSRVSSSLHFVLTIYIFIVVATQVICALQILILTISQLEHITVCHRV